MCVCVVYNCTGRRTTRRKDATRTHVSVSSEAPPAPPNVLDEGLPDPLPDPLDEPPDDPEQRVHGDPCGGGQRAPPLRRHDPVRVQPVHHVLGAPGVEAVPARQALVHEVVPPPRPPAHLAHEARLLATPRRRGQHQRVLVRRRQLHPRRHRRAARVHVEPARRAPEREALHGLAADVALAPKETT